MWTNHNSSRIKFKSFKQYKLRLAGRDDQLISQYWFGRRFERLFLINRSTFQALVRRVLMLQSKDVEFIYSNKPHSPKLLEQVKISMYQDLMYRLRKISIFQDTEGIKKGLPIIPIIYYCQNVLLLRLDWHVLVIRLTRHVCRKVVVGLPLQVSAWLVPVECATLGSRRWSMRCAWSRYLHLWFLWHLSQYTGPYMWQMDRFVIFCWNRMLRTFIKIEIF